MTSKIKPILQTFKWLITIIVVWLSYQLFTILTFPHTMHTDKADVAIVLGAAVYNEKPSPVFAERLNHAINLYHEGSVKKLIFTGGTSPKMAKQDQDSERFAESVVARSYAIKNHVDPNDILIETQSLTTLQNLHYAAEIIQRENFEAVLLVSDSLHLKRALLMAHNLNINALPSGTPSSLYKSLKTRLPFALRELYFYHHYLLFDQ